ncbi:uncharacterized protein LOC111374508 [Olea europaea var. sylvestris]|uniref:uncharacterized protein LOC111374508 n=1 Tax=Olea europaea var. sylvestris TaxID=158386 RepID=UPI000C1D745E|nr:uncharacterized protein LOC111374508 [Olea europaea var. sylvestris]
MSQHRECSLEREVGSEATSYVQGSQPAEPQLGDNFPQEYKEQRAFHLTLGGATEVWYSRLPPLSIRSWPDLKKAFFNQYLSSLKGGHNINTLFWKDVPSKNPATYDELVEMMRMEIVSEEMIDHRNNAAQGLPPPQRQALASATLNVVPVLAYENAPGEAGPSGRTDSKKKKKRLNRPLEGTMFCTFHQLYGQDTNECRDAPRSSDRSESHPFRRNEYLRRSASPNRGERRHREQSPRRRESRDQGESRKRDQASFSGAQIIRKIDTIIGGPHIDGNTRNAQRNYTREANDPPMITYIVNESQEANKIAPITFSQEDAQGVHHSHCDALVVRAVVARNGLKRMLIDNGSSVNILFGSTFDKMQIQPMIDPLLGFTGDSIIP